MAPFGMDQSQVYPSNVVQLTITMLRALFGGRLDAMVETLGKNEA